ncbi:peptidase S8/S53 domain-containing protein, partial [Lactarius quietus]
PYVTSVGGTTGGTGLGPEIAANLSERRRPRVPDISAQALNFFIIYRNALSRMGGTSCATPTPLGFLNPLLYGHLRPAMNDITSGSNPGCNTTGFSAVPGWDPVTGLGTPDFLNLMALRDLMDIF